MAANASFEFKPSAPIGDVNAFDVLFDGQHVMSFSQSEVSKSGDLISFEWPSELKQFLDGSALLEIQDASKHLPIFSEEVAFTKSNRRVQVKNLNGDPLFVNKFNALAVKISNNQSLRQKIVASAKKLESELTSEGFRTAICSGTLLGAMRNGKMLEHDDDIDMLFFSDESDIGKLNAYTGNLLQTLKRLGYEALQHTGAHVQVLYLNEENAIEYYIDFFLGFFKDGNYNQPFALRTPIPKGDIFPFSNIKFEGTEFNAPAKPESWLEALYGNDWQTPNPAYHFNPSKQTNRDFVKWFGLSRSSYINFWNRYSTTEQFWQPEDGLQIHLDFVKKHLSKEIPILDIGFGNGITTQALADAGYEVIGIDYLPHAVWKARKLHPNLNLHQVNLLQPPDIAEFKKILPAKFNISCSFGFNAFWTSARASTLKLLQSGSKAVISFDSDFNPEIFSYPNQLTRPLTLKREILELAASKCFIAKSQSFTRNASINQSTLVARKAKIQLIKRF